MSNIFLASLRAPKYASATSLVIVGCTMSSKGCPTKSTLHLYLRYASASNGKIDATLVTYLRIVLPRLLCHAQIVGAI